MDAWPSWIRPFGNFNGLSQHSGPLAIIPGDIPNRALYESACL